jgi:hypothetical protein
MLVRSFDNHCDPARLVDAAPSSAPTILGPSSPQSFTTHLPTSAKDAFQKSRDERRRFDRNDVQIVFGLGFRVAIAIAPAAVLGLKPGQPKAMLAAQDPDNCLAYELCAF